MVQLQLKLVSAVTVLLPNTSKSVSTPFDLQRFNSFTSPDIGFILGNVIVPLWIGFLSHPAADEK